MTRQLLTERQGDPYRIIAAYRKEIKDWSQIKAGDVDACQKFQNFLVKRENIGHLKSWNVLDTPGIMWMLLSKLQGSAREKWSRNVLTICRRHKREPDLTDFIHFVNDETLSVIQSFQKRQLSNIVIKSQIAEGLKFHHLLQRMMAKYMFKKDHQIASIVVKIIYWIGAIYL